MPRTRKRRVSRATHPNRPATKRVKRDADYSPRLSPETVKSALAQLLDDSKKHETRRALNAAGKGKSIADIADNELYVYLVITLKQPPYKPLLRPHTIPLKHSIFTAGEDDVCFFVKDPQRQIKDYLAEFSKGEVTRVMGVDKLRKRYKTHEGRRELLNMYDLFLVDNRVAPMMPNLLGSAFIRAKKMPLSVDMRRDVVAGIRKAIHSTAFAPIQGTCSTMRVGKVDFGVDRLVENVCGAMDVVIRKIEGGWHDVQSVNLKTNKSPALPIYLTMPTALEVSKKASEEVSGKERENKDTSQKENVVNELKRRGKVSGKEQEDNDVSQKEKVVNELKRSAKGSGKEQEDKDESQKKKVVNELNRSAKVSGKEQKDKDESQKKKVVNELKRSAKDVENGSEKTTKKKRKSSSHRGETRSKVRENYINGEAWGAVN